MEMKKIHKAVLATILATSITPVFAGQTKTIDFYSTNGNNRYSISGSLRDLKLTAENNTILVKEANQTAYVTLNNKLPYHVRFIENDMNLSQLMESNKDTKIKYNNKEVKILMFKGDSVVAESDEGIIFIPIEKVVLPKTAMKNSSKGLMATFNENIKDEDKLFYSQEERNLRYSNLYSSKIIGNKINLAHYFNITNMSAQTFEDVYLNFFLSQTNIMSDRVRPLMGMAPMKASVENHAVAAMAPPVFEQEEVQSLKTISLKDPVTIYPNLNKFKYSEKTYDLEQYAQIEMNKVYHIYLNNITKEDRQSLNLPDSKLNKALKESVENIRKEILINNLQVNNMLNIKVPQGDILPGGKIDIYDNVKGIDKLIVSTNISHMENEKVEVVKSKNNDLKLVDVVFNSIDKKDINFDVTNNLNVELLIKSVTIENLGSEAYTINIFNKKQVINPKSKITINA